MKTRIVSFLTATFILLSFSIYAQESVDAKEIVKKATNKLNGKTSQGTMKMTVVRPDWSREN